MLKNTLFATAAASMLTSAMLFSATTQAAPMDVAVNGGFETGDFSGWTQFPNGGIQSVVMPGNGSTYAANLEVPVRTQMDPPVDNLIKNANLAAGQLTPGAAVTVTWDMKGELIGAGGVIFIELFSELAGGGTSKAEIYTGGPLNPTADWSSYEWNTTLGPDVAGGVTLQLKTSCGPVEGCGVNAYFDNITITTDVAPVPLPAAAWLFGSALLGLGGLAKKRRNA